MNTQLGGNQIAPIWNTNEITFLGQRWKATTLGNYIPMVIIPSQSTLVARYYEPIFALNPTTKGSQLECNQLLNHLEMLHNLEWKPSHQSNFQPHVELVKIITIPLMFNNTTTDLSCLAGYTYHGNNWMTISSTKHTGYKPTSQCWNCNMCILSTSWSWVQKLSLCGL